MPDRVYTAELYRVYPSERARLDILAGTLNGNRDALHPGALIVFEVRAPDRSSARAKAKARLGRSRERSATGTQRGYPQPGSALRYDARYGTVLEPVTVLARIKRPGSAVEYRVRYRDGEERVMQGDYVSLGEVRGGNQRVRRDHGPQLGYDDEGNRLTYYGTGIQNEQAARKDVKRRYGSRPTEQPVSRPGARFYVTARQGSRTAFVLGPYASHMAAQAHVAEGRRLVEEKTREGKYGGVAIGTSSVGAPPWPRALFGRGSGYEGAERAMARGRSRSRTPSRPASVPRVAVPHEGDLVRAKPPVGMLHVVHVADNGRAVFGVQERSGLYAEAARPSGGWPLLERAGGRYRRRGTAGATRAERKARRR